MTRVDYQGKASEDNEGGLTMTGTPYTCSSSSLDFMRVILSRFCSSSSSSLSDRCTGSRKSVAEIRQSTHEAIMGSDGIRLTSSKICDRDLVKVSFLWWDGSSEELLDFRGRDHNVLVERQLFVPLPDRHDNLDERPAKRGPPYAEERIV